MLAIIDYGVGNLYSLCSSLSFLGLEAKIVTKAQELQRADKIILPGVGAFANAITKLHEHKMAEEVKKQAANGKPLIGICLGMQLLFEKSYEYGERAGLGLIPGTIASIEDDLPPGSTLKVPHMGWNSLNILKDDPIFKYIKSGEHVYYVHSFYGKDCQDNLLATSEYGVEIAGVVKKDNVYGCQFHPEKSRKTGLGILKAFAEIV